MDRPLEDRGRGECRELAAPMARLQKKMQAAGTTGSAETSRHSPRGWLERLLRVLPGAPGFLATVCATTRKRVARGYQRRDIRTTRLDRAHRAVRPRGSTTLQHDTPTASRLNVRDDREAPLM